MVQVQAGIVNRFLPSSKFTIYRNRSCKIGTIISILGTKIHQYQFAIFTLLIVLHIMQCSCPVAACYDGTVSLSGSPLC